MNFLEIGTSNKFVFIKLSKQYLGHLTKISYMRIWLNSYFCGKCDSIGFKTGQSFCWFKPIRSVHFEITFKLLHRFRKFGEIELSKNAFLMESWSQPIRSFKQICLSIKKKDKRKYFCKEK